VKEMDILSRIWKTVGYGGEISVIAVPIPSGKTDSWESYKEKMKYTEKEFVKKLSKLIN